MSDYPIRLSMNLPARPPLSMLKKTTLIARATGLDTLVLWDHFQDFIPQAYWNEELFWMAKELPSCHAYYDYQSLLGYLAGRAGNLRLAVGVTAPSKRHPVLIAQSALTLAHMTKRPPVLGLGTGERSSLEPYGMTVEKPVGQLEEALQIIRTCFTTTGPFDFTGDHFQLQNAVMDLKAPPGNTPRIWLASHGPRMLRLTGQYADGWYPLDLFDTEEYGDALQTIRRHALEAVRDPDDILPTLNATVVVAPSMDEARDIFTLRQAKFAGLLLPDKLWQRHGLTHPFGEGFRGYPEILAEEVSEEAYEAALDRVPVEVLEDGCFWGTPETLARDFRAFGKAGMRNVVIFPISPLASPRYLRYLPRALWSLRRKLA